MADGRTINILMDFIRERNYKRFAELGVASGGTLRRILSRDSVKSLEEYHAIDTWKGYRGSTDEQWEKVYQGLLKLSDKDKRLNLVRKKTSEAVNYFSDAHFDMVFVDADHTYTSVREDILNWLPKIRMGGLLIGHDYNMGGVRDAVNSVFSQFLITRMHKTWAFEVGYGYLYAIRDDIFRKKLADTYPKEWS